MVITDFDGTLYSDKKSIDKKDIDTLIMLGRKGIKRAIATGRSLFSAKKVIDDDFPIDYLIFSSGAGVMNWRTKTIEHSFSIDTEEIKKTVNFLSECEYDFMLHKSIPENHYFYPVKVSNRENIDFDRRCDIYKDYIIEWDKNAVNRIERACQFVVVRHIEEGDNPGKIYSDISEKLSGLKVIRTTSPLDRKTLWIEIFSKKVSKSLAADIICKKENIGKKDVMVIGNDYNDLDMLKWGEENSFVVDNAPEDIKALFRVVGSNNQCGFSEAVEKWLYK